VSSLRRLGKDGLIYGVGSVAAKASGIVFLPIFTRILTPEEFGNIELVTVVTGILSVFLVMGLDSAQFFYFFKARQEGQEGPESVVT